MLKIINNNYSKNPKNLKKKSLSRDNSTKSFKQIKQKREKLPKKDIFLYSWGKNKYGELGIDTFLDVNIPTPITSLTTKNIIDVKPGGRNTILIKKDGSLYLCGSNIFGLLARDEGTVNNELTQKTFKQIKYFQEKNINIKDISIAEFHCLALDIEGNILGWGGNLFNKLGTKNISITGIPTEIYIKNKIKLISCGDYHSCALSEDGILYTWGGGGPSYNHGQCGHGNLKDIQNPKKVEFFTKNNIKIKKVTCGGYHTIVLGENNEDIYSFGKGIFGQLGYGQPENSSKPKKVLFNKKQNIKYENNENINIIDIKCGGEHSLFLSSNNHLYVCGHGYYGQLGLGNNKNINSPLIVKSLMNKIIIEIAAGWSHSLVLSNELNIYSTGCNKYGELGIGKKIINSYNYVWVNKLSKLNIKHISAGGHHSWCLLDNNEPLRKNKNSPEPLLKSNFSMNKKFRGKKLSNLSQDLDESFSNDNNKSVISADDASFNKRKMRGFEDEEDNNNSNNRMRKKRNLSQMKIKKIIEDYNDDNDMSVDDLIDGIDNINKNADNLNDSDIIDDKDLDCKLKIIYTDLNLSHRFIRFHSSLDFNKIKSIILENYINKNSGIISYQFQRDDEIEKDKNNFLVYIKKIYNTIKRSHLINVEELANTYTLGIVYDYKKNEKIFNYKENMKLIKKEKIKPICGFKVLNSYEILNNENNIEKELSDWIIKFNKIYNKFIIGENNEASKKEITFLELRPNTFNLFE